MLLRFDIYFIFGHEYFSEMNILASDNAIFQLITLQTLKLDAILKLEICPQFVFCRLQFSIFMLRNMEIPNTTFLNKVLDSFEYMVPVKSESLEYR